jgi:hypothetical protein
MPSEGLKSVVEQAKMVAFIKGDLFDLLPEKLSFGFVFDLR